jgi:iron complex outermembrane recepter protein
MRLDGTLVEHFRKTSGPAHHLVPVVFGIVFLAGTSEVAFAQSPGGAESENTGSALTEVVVTATRTATNAQNVPIAVSAIRGEELRENNIVEPSQLTALAPNLYVDQGESSAMTHVSIRGLASTDFSVGASSPVATYIDDIYQPFQFGLATQIFDMNRIEVLRGPQGTLFGKNATGGALAYYSQTPTRNTEGYVQLTGGAGDFTHYGVEGAYNTPLSDTIATRVSVLITRRNDYVENLYNGSELGHEWDFNGRIQFSWTPSDNLAANLKIFGLKSYGDGPIYIGQWLGGECAPPAYIVYNMCANGVPAPDSPNSRQTYSEFPIPQDYYVYGATLKVDYKFSSAILTSITGWQRGSFSMRTNDTGTEGDLFHSLQADSTEQFSQEVRVATDPTKPVHAVVGAFGEYDQIEADQASGSTTTDPSLGFDYYNGGLATQYTTTLAGFSSVTGDVTSWFSLVGGLRYSYERKHILNRMADLYGYNTVSGETRDFTEADLSYPTVINQFPPNPEYGDVTEFDRKTASWNKLTWDATANFKPSESSLVYAKVATGFRSGGFPVGTQLPGLFVELKPETVTSYEIGFKSEWLHHSFRLNGAIFDMDYKDMQVQTNNTTGPGLIYSNAGSSRIKGAELELEYAPIPMLRLNGAAGYSDAKYLTYLSPQGSLAGNYLPYAPTWTANLGATWEIPVATNRSVFLESQWRYRSEVYFDPYNTPNIDDPARVFGDLNVGYGTQDKGWRVSVYADNVTNQNYKVFSYALGFVDPSIYGPRRIWGLKLDYTF